MPKHRKNVRPAVKRMLASAPKKRQKKRREMRRELQLKLLKLKTTILLLRKRLKKIITLMRLKRERSMMQRLLRSQLLKQRNSQMTHKRKSKQLKLSQKKCKKKFLEQLLPNQDQLKLKDPTRKRTTSVKRKNETREVVAERKRLWSIVPKNQQSQAPKKSVSLQ